MRKMINSHVQISKLLLKPFAHKTEEGLKVWCLNLESNVITEEKISELDTVFGYYDEDVEENVVKFKNEFDDFN